MPLTDTSHLVHRQARGVRRLAAGLVGANLVIALLLAAMVWQILQTLRASYEAQAAEVSAGLAAVAQLNIESEIGRVDAVIRATEGELQRLLAARGEADAEVVNGILQARFQLLADIEAFRLTDAAGLVRWGTALPAGAPARVDDRDYFRQARALAEPATLVAGPLKSRVSGNWVIAFVRPLRVNGRFEGVLYVSIATEHFRQLFGRYDLERLDAITLRKNDLQLVARLSPGSPAQGDVGDKVVSPELLSHLAANPRQGTYVARVAVDKELRTTSYRALEAWPFVVYAGVNNERFLQPWRQQAAVIASLAGLVWLLGAVATWTVHKANRRRVSAMKELADASQRTRALLRVAADGIHIVDARGRLVEMSDSFADMLKSTRERLLGRHISSWDVNQDEAAIDAWLRKVKVGDRQRVDVSHRRDDGQVIDVELNMSVTDIAGELMVFSSGRDVTQVRRLAREQSAMLDTDLLGIAKISGRTITWHNRAAAHILGYGTQELVGQPTRRLFWDDASCEALGREVYDALNAESQYRSQVRLRRKDGATVWLDVGAARLSATVIFVMAVDITAMKEVHERLTHAAFHDPLTGLPNRLLLTDRVEQALAVARREDKWVAIGYLDLDGFKAVNDQHGHDAGDQLLREIADRLLQGIRPADTAARIGGDEFVIVLASIEPGGWEAVFQRLVHAIEQPVRLASGAVVFVGATVGVALADSTKSAYEVIEEADHAMLKGKRGTKGTVVGPARLAAKRSAS